jgi:aminoglycoside phosphotransferase (APT) family kinase protein
MGSQDFTDLLTAAVRKRRGNNARVSDVTRLTAGASCESWRFDLSDENPAKSLPMILRRFPAKSEAGKDVYFADRLAPGRSHEVDILKAVGTAGLPVPVVQLELAPDDGLGDGYVMNCLDGAAYPPGILKDDKFAKAREQLPSDIATFRHQLNSVDLSNIGFAQDETARDQIDFFREMLDWLDLQHAGLELGLSWLRDHLPKPGPVRLVHGDYRLSNFMITPKGLNAVIDWELAHPGDPVEDLGWLCVRSWRFSKPQLAVAGLTDRRSLLAAWEQAGGETIVLRDLIFWEVLGNVKWAILCLLQGHRYLSGTDKSIEMAVVGRRVEEPVYDLIRLIDGKDGELS